MFTKIESSCQSVNSLITFTIFCSKTRLIVNQYK
uniref:Uncharacterized protein n=1 Tax=Siphoviridae sp. ctXZx16 TaxID=2826371 RepID=A0A8S5MKR6_9CAUD|nr:MAG TPA: hypothetical protein [Siphoviridae sp. ctXZx16]